MAHNLTVPEPSFMALDRSIVGGEGEGIKSQTVAIRQPILDITMEDRMKTF